MTDYITTCVRCHADSTEVDGAYCSEECKQENESPRTEHNGPSWLQMLRCEEITGVSVGEQE